MIKRRSQQIVGQALGRQAAVALVGPRQVGKTTLGLEIAKSRPALYLDLESREDRVKLTEPALFLKQYEDKLVILDEIHRVPDLFQTLRGLIDQGRRRGHRTGRFLILGSASIDLLDRVSALPTERRLLFLHCYAGGAGRLFADRKHSRIARRVPNRQASLSVYDRGSRDIV